MRGVHWQFAIVALLGSGSPIWGQVPLTVPPPPEILTRGVRTVVLPADRAVIRIEIAALGESAATALGAGTPPTARVRQALLDAGVSADDLEIGAFWAGPISEDGERSGRFEARTTLEVLIRDLSRLPPVMATALSAGATRISGISFASDTADLAHRTALTEAFKAAQAEAFTLALAAGGRLGALQAMTTVPDSLLTGSDPGQTVSPSQPYSLKPRVEVRVMVETRWTFIPR